jgi:hypothetical protein
LKAYIKEKPEEWEMQNTFTLWFFWYCFELYIWKVDHDWITQCQNKWTCSASY